MQYLSRLMGAREAQPQLSRKLLPDSPFFCLPRRPDPRDLFKLRPLPRELASNVSARPFAWCTLPEPFSRKPLCPKDEAPEKLIPRRGVRRCLALCGGPRRTLWAPCEARARVLLARQVRRVVAGRLPGGVCNRSRLGVRRNFRFACNIPVPTIRLRSITSGFVRVRRLTARPSTPRVGCMRLAPEEPSVRGRRAKGSHLASLQGHRHCHGLSRLTSSGSREAHGDHWVGVCQSPTTVHRSAGRSHSGSRHLDVLCCVPKHVRACSTIRAAAGMSVYPRQAV